MNLFTNDDQSSDCLPEASIDARAGNAAGGRLLETPD